MYFSSLLQPSLQQWLVLCTGYAIIGVCPYGPLEKDTEPQLCSGDVFAEQEGLFTSGYTAYEFTWTKDSHT